MILKSFVFLALILSTRGGISVDKPSTRIADAVLRAHESSLVEFDSFGHIILRIIESIVSTGRTGRIFGVEGRKHKKIKLNKYILPLIVGFLLIKSILLPLALKALAILSGKAIVLSLMSLILAAIIGLKHVAMSRSSPHSRIDTVNLPLTHYRRKDYFDQEDQLEEDPYRYYSDHRKRRRK
ncbi:hypothetical protein QAD02_020147 [Eretmocerus hayati]|uniref:Uncharacterized protein n=1 Tax=Eretmocerus hayati TaxID=131215 RepID=A0ACC2PLA3_9HYME|nr:hypothetical protein QAD02_020147 [Eretmocerus hayati]